MDEQSAADEDDELEGMLLSDSDSEDDLDIE